MPAGSRRYATAQIQGPVRPPNFLSSHLAPSFRGGRRPNPEPRGSSAIVPPSLLGSGSTLRVVRNDGVLGDCGCGGEGAASPKRPNMANADSSSFHFSNEFSAAIY